jgi:hypothetical protein
LDIGCKVTAINAQTMTWRYTNASESSKHQKGRTHSVRACRK